MSPVLKDDGSFNTNSIESKLYLAAAKGNEKTVSRLLLAGADPNLKSNSHGTRMTPLMAAASANHAGIVKLLIASGARLEDKNAEIDPASTQEKTALHFAASSVGVETLKALLLAGANVNAEDSTGSTPICYAALAGNVAAVKVLSENGAGLNVRPKRAFSLIACAVISKSDNLLDLLFQLGAKLAPNDPAPLQRAISNRDASAVQKLLRHGANPDATDSLGFTALMLAAKFGAVDIVKSLLAAGAKTDTKNRDGKSALDYARINRHAGTEALIWGVEQS